MCTLVGRNSFLLFRYKIRARTAEVKGSILKATVSLTEVDKHTHGKSKDTYHRCTDKGGQEVPCLVKQGLSAAAKKLGARTGVHNLNLYGFTEWVVDVYHDSESGHTSTSRINYHR